MKPGAEAVGCLNDIGTGRIKSGTIVMFAVDENGRVLKASKMQGVTILARFQNMEDL